MLDCKTGTTANGGSIVSKSKKIEGGFHAALAGLIQTDSLQTMNVTPAMASVMMERNTGNRTLSASRVSRYAKDMKDGNWALTGEPVIFSKEGVLNDGQTRLSACIEADMPFQTDVRFGIAREAFKVTGCGAKRTLSDVFSICGEPNATKLSGALNWLNRYHNGFGSAKLGHLDGQAMLVENPDLRKSIEPGSQFYRETKLMEPSLAIFLHYIFALKDTDKADEFFRFLTDGLGATSKNDPRNVVRARLIVNRGDKAKLPSHEIAALMIKAWNLYRKGKEIGTLKWVSNPAKGAGEPFPRAM